MPLTSIRSSTQDGAAGTPVATVVNEDDSTKAVQAACLVGNKSTYPEAARTGLTAADSATDLSTAGFAGTAGANLADCGNALALACRATCSVASATLGGRVIFYDAADNPIAFSEPISFTSDSSRRLASAGDYVSQRVLIDAGSARKFAFYVESLSTGTWALSVRPL